MSVSWTNRDPPGPDPQRNSAEWIRTRLGILDPQQSETVRVVLLSRGDERLDPVWGLYRWDKESCEYRTTNLSVRAVSWQHALTAFEKFEATQMLRGAA